MDPTLKWILCLSVFICGPLAAEDAQQIAQLIGKLATAEGKPRAEAISALARYGAKAHDQALRSGSCFFTGRADPGI